jgi:hypothetical protein
LLLTAFSSNAQDIYFDASGEMSASRDWLEGQLTLTLKSAQPIYNVEILARAQGEPQGVGGVEYWHPDTSRTFHFRIASPHRWGGDYHLLVDVLFQDMMGADLGTSIALSYPVNDEVTLSPPGVDIRGAAVHWSASLDETQSIMLETLLPPPWGRGVLRIAPPEAMLPLAQAALPAKPNWLYPETARLTWVEHGVHGSRALRWAATTDGSATLRDIPENTLGWLQLGHTRLRIETNATLTSTQDSLRGEVTLQFDDAATLHNVAWRLVAADGVAHSLGQQPEWPPRTAQTLRIDVPSLHAYPGVYHALLQVSFDDDSGARLSSTVPLEYHLRRAAVTPRPVSVALAGSLLQWNVANADANSARLTVTSAPAWLSPPALTAQDTHLQLQRDTRRIAVPNWRYVQKARLEWLQGGRHFSEVFDWQLATDDQGEWQPNGSGKPAPRWWRSPWNLGAAALVLLALAVAQVRQRHTSAAAPAAERQELWGVVGVGALSVWMISHAAPEWWLARTWSTGGDIASQMYYARIFMEWFPTGKLSGWLPESFAGFPAFTFYFPFPFILSALLALPFGEQVAFKLASMVPAFVLPAATYAMATLWRWPVVTRMLAAAGAAAFVLAEATSIWGGNALAQLSGEFAYSWGMVNTALCWGWLALALRRGGRWWLVAALWEALVALSHGYALLVCGFGAFLFLLFSPARKHALRIILQVHTLAFLLVSFWLLPLAENLPWTIPNDTSTNVEHWQILLPPTLWPLLLGLLPLLWALRRSEQCTGGLGFLLGVICLGLLGFFAGHNVGLAELRFFPYAQWALAVACGAALGWAIQHWKPQAALALSLAVMAGLTAWWEPHIANLEGWSRWNLSGYENKPMWQHYFLAAQTNAGPLHGPRLAFEHDPDNNDIGSTRALEALPMFGSRPTLEGLYMESAISSPFIYQLQEEISQRPSSPLSRYPTTARSIDAAIGHMNELYTNRLLLRSPAMQQRFADDGRFALIAASGPLQSYELIDFHAQLVEAQQQPLVAASRQHWLDQAFRRFVLAHPYSERQVYLKAGQQLPAYTHENRPATIVIKEFSREKLAFDTDAVGQPHLIRMTYHPRWQSAGGETIYLTDPSFMLIFPQSTHVELGYGWGWGNWLGNAFSGLGLVIVGITLVRRESVLRPQAAGSPQRALLPLLVLAGVSGLALSISWWTDPEHVYYRAHRYFANNDWSAAAPLFDQAYPQRKIPAARAEALFWAARSYDLAGAKKDAETRYRELWANFPENYWYAESVFRLLEISLARGDVAEAQKLKAELQSQVPTSRWTDEARRVLPP